MTTDELRKKYLDFFISKQHRLVPSDSLIPRNDPTLLFTGAGMNQFKEEFLGRIKDYCRATTCQKCLRTPDLENVGKTAGHHTFFEMLGNFSFGDYFKKEAITWAWEFLTKELGLSVDKLVVSVYEEDDEAFQVWHKEAGLPLEKIYRFNAKENYWPANAPADGPNGPCGPCSEIFYDQGAELSCGQPKCDPSCGCDRYVEIWNLVFTQFDRQADASLKPLPNKNIDTGMGLERMAAVIQGVKNNFQIDIFKPIIEDICKTAQIKYNQNPAADSHVQAIADHIRAVTFIIGDGALGSNEGRGYVLRSLIRRSIGHGRALGIDKNFLYKLVAVVVEVMKEPYPQLLKRRENIAQIVESEEKQYDRTLKEAQDILEDKIKGLKDEGKTVIPASGDFAFELYDTYGLPVDITEEIVSKGGFSINREQFNKAMKSRQEQSRQGSKMKGDIFGDDLLDGLDKQHLKTAFVGYDKLESECKIIALYKGTDQVEEAQEGDEVELVLDKTSFYGETGGQAGDKGYLEAKGLEVEIADVKKIGECILHIGQIKKGKVSVGLKLKASVGAERRMNICRNHTATHLLHWALRTVLGEHVQQAGSMVAPDRLRFDFTHFKEVTKEQLIRIEDLVNTEILNNALVKVREMDQQEAIDSGAIALFGEKYAQKVRVVSISDFSSELCGGTHLDSIGQIGIFKIISESS
ncbi:MAG: alanine--tRNA ligase, partial [Candidatus Omnitrophica bacterium]|nr:alanine--tRNA ligase [Candidatus Omnitrophota bacterium]